MGVLSKGDLIKRIMIGEMLVNPNERVKECLQNLEKAEDIFREHFKELASDPENLSKHKQAIRNFIEENLLGKEADEIRSNIESKLKDMENPRRSKVKMELPIFIDDVDPECLKGANYDLRLGEDVYVTTEKVPKKLTRMGKNGVVSIEPGEFGILMTHEYIFAPLDLMGFISVRLTHKQKGLVNISGFHVDPGFYGRLMFAVFNAGPNDVPLRYKEPVFMVMFNELTKDAEKIRKSRWSGMENIPIETLSGLRGTSVSVRNLDERIRRLEILFPILLTGIISVAVAVIAWILTHWPE